MFFKFYYYKLNFFIINKSLIKITSYYNKLWFASIILANLLFLKMPQIVVKLLWSQKSKINILIRILLFIFLTYTFYLQAKHVIDSLPAYNSPSFTQLHNNTFQVQQSSVNWGDYGTYFLNCSVSSVGNVFSNIFTGNDFIFNSEISFYGFAIFILMPVFLVLLPNIPLSISFGSVIALYLVLSKVIYTAYAPIYHFSWITGWAVVLCSIFLVTVFIIKNDFLGWIYLIVSSLIIGHLAFLRTACKFIPFAMVISLLGVMWTIIAISYFYKKKFTDDIFKKMFLNDTLRITIFCSIFLGIIILETEVFRYAVSRATKTPYTSTKLIGHGTGHPLYIGLGGVANPYNIAWDDYVGGLNYLLFTKADVGKSGGVTIFHTHEYDNLLYQEWRQIIKESPALLIHNIFAKSLFIHNFLLKQEIKNPDNNRIFDHTQTSKLFTFLYIFLIFYMLSLMIMILLYRGGIYIILFFSFLGIMAAGSAGTLIVYQGYVKGVYGIIIASFFVMFPGTYEISKRNYFPVTVENKHIYVIFTKLVLIISVLGILSIGTFTGYTSYKNYSAANKLVSGSPVYDIQVQGYDYSISFNRLSVEKQKSIIYKLKNSGGDNIVPRKEFVKGNLGIFNPEILIFSDQQVHLITYLGKKWTKPIYEVDQGFISSTIVITRNYDNSFTYISWPSLPVNRYIYTFILDYEWTGKYKMYSFPVSDDFKSAQSFLVDTHYSFGFKNINISTNRFFWQ